MKKISSFLCAGFLLLSYGLNGQIYLEQGFEDNFPPSGWTRYKQGSGQVKHWAQTSDASHSGGRSAYHIEREYYQDAWLVSPPIDLSGAIHPALSYWDLVLYFNKADAHEVLVSTDYVSGENPWDYTWDTLCNMIGRYYWQYAGNIPLGDYITPGVFIAWHYLGEDAAEWYIDDILVYEADETPVNDSCHNAIILNVSYPESTTDSTTWATFDCQGTLDFWNGIWYELTLPYVCNTLEINISALEADLISTGIILAEDCSCQSSTYFYADSSAFTSDTSVFIGFYGLEGPGTVYFPLNVEPLQEVDLTINAGSLCIPPGNLDVATNGESIVELTWTEEGCASAWQVEHGLYGLLPSGDPTITGIDSLPCQVAGLEPGQCYQFRVRSVCDSGIYSDWSETMAFCTDCPSKVDSFQYLWNYEPPVFPPNCWTTSSTSDSSWTYGITLQPPVTHLTFCSWHPTQVQDEWLITPAMDLSSITSPALSFNWMTSYQWLVDSNYADLRLLISLDGGASWGDTLFSEDDAGVFMNWEWNYTQVDLTAYSSQSNVAFAFVYSGTNGDAFAFDNFVAGPMTTTTSWTGEVNTDWYNVGNWDNYVPMECTSASFPDVSGSTQHNPVTNNVAHCYDLTVGPGGHLTIGEGTRIHVLHGTTGPSDNISPSSGENRLKKRGNSYIHRAEVKQTIEQDFQKKPVPQQVRDKKISNRKYHLSLPTERKEDM